MTPVKDYRMVLKILILIGTIASQLLVMAGCSAIPNELYMECSGKGDLHLPMASGSVECPAPGLKLSIGRQAPVLPPGSTNTPLPGPCPPACQPGGVAGSGAK